MAMKFENISKKIIGLGEVTILPGETKDVPKEFEKNPILDFYKKKGMAKITGRTSAPEKTPEQIAKEKEEAEKKAAKEAEELRKARVASLKDITDEDLGKLAIELGINPAECKDQADVLAKVKEALKK